MASLTQVPHSLSFSRNLLDVIITTSSSVRFRLYKGASLLLDEKYLPDSSNRVIIDIRDVVTDSLSVYIPTSDTFEQTNAVASFSIFLDSSETADATFTAILGGISGNTAAAGTWLAANFLTWQAQEKDVRTDQPEWLTYYFAGTESLKAKFYNKDNTTKTITLLTGTAGKVYSVNCMFSHLWELGETTVDNTVKERWGIIDVWVEDGNATRKTYIQRYCYRQGKALDQVYLCHNSLGGIDTFIFTGSLKFNPEMEHTVAAWDDIDTAAATSGRKKWSQNTGLITASLRNNLWEMFRSLNAYYLRDATITPIVIESSEIETSNIETSNSCTFTYRISDDDGLLNVTRDTSIPELLEFPGPEDALFFLAPRLSVCPEAVLTDELLIPLQSPAPLPSDWQQTTIADLRDYIGSGAKELTQAGYDALTQIDRKQIYLIYDGVDLMKVYIGSTLFAQKGTPAAAVFPYTFPIIFG